MALRSLDNTLPLSPERPKKAIKVANSIPVSKPKQPAGSKVNDENKFPVEPVVAPVVDSIDYISSENLKPVAEPDVRFKVSMFIFVVLIVFL